MKISPLAPFVTTTANFAPFLTSQQQPFTFGNTLYRAPFTQYAYNPRQQYWPQFVTFLSNMAQKPITTTTISKTPTTPKLNKKEREPTTRKPQEFLQVKPPKLQLKPQQTVNTTTAIPSNIVGDFKNDAALLRAVKKINPEYIIEEIINVPTKHAFSTKTTGKSKIYQNQIRNTQTQITSQNKEQTQQIPKLLDKKQTSKKALKTATSRVIVEAIGKTSTKGNIPEISYGSYFLPYYSNQIQQQQQQQQATGKKTAALILEPHSKAIVGNGGTAISTPISKAYLKRGVTTNVYFNPESVAIAGVGGKAHAQADLELDLIN